LTELGAGDKPTLTVFNKVDAADEAMIQRARQLVPDALFVSAHTRTGLDQLEARCVELIADAFKSTELLVPHARYDVIARLHEFGDIQEQEELGGSVRIKGRFPPTQARFFAPFVVQPK